MFDTQNNTSENSPNITNFTVKPSRKKTPAKKTVSGLKKNSETSPAANDSAKYQSLIEDILGYNPKITLRDLMRISPKVGVELRKSILAIKDIPPESITRNINQTSIRKLYPTTEVLTTCKIQGYDMPIKTSLDSGAEMNNIPKGLINELNWEVDDSNIDFYIRSDTTDSISTPLGWCYDVPICIEGIIITGDFVVSDSPGKKLILGTPWLHKAKGHILFDQEKFRFVSRGREYIIPVSIVRRKKGNSVPNEHPITDKENVRHITVSLDGNLSESEEDSTLQNNVQLEQEDDAKKNL